MAQSIARENAEVNREKKLQDYFSQPQRGTVRGRSENPAAKEGYINRQEGAAHQIVKNKPNQAVNSHRSGPQAQSKIAQGNNRSASQLDTIETVSDELMPIICNVITNSAFLILIERREAERVSHRDRRLKSQH